MTDAPSDPGDLASDEDLTDVEPEADAAQEVPDHRRFVYRRDGRKRLDQFLRERVPKASRNQLQKLIEAGGVTVNGKTPKASTALREGDIIDVILPPRAVGDLAPEPIPLDILHEEPGFIVINKQDDLIVHPARSHLSGTLLNALVYHFQQSASNADARAGLSGVGSGELRPGVIHRLDKHTTGVIVVAKDDEDHWKIARQFEDRKTLKAYMAVVHGNFDTEGGVVDAPIGKHPTIREAMAVRHDSVGKPSVTLYRVREQYKGYSLVELELRTGRTHQIRVHMSYLGHPLVGDILYGGEVVGPAEIAEPPIAAGSRSFVNFARPKAEGERIEAEAAGRADVLMARPSLHAALLRFTHPRTGQPVTFTAPMHGPLARLIAALRKHRIDAPVATEGYHVDLATVFRDLETQ